ncbi:hypothetical protein EMCRGX_G014310 [Ephydatia muelleri]|eukprot:Em0005g1595a
MADSLILLQKDNTFTKLFVGGLPYHTTDETLREYFLQFGDIEEAVVIHDRVTGKSKGYGFVTMADREGAEKACSNPNPVVDGRRANVNLAYLGARPKHGQPGSPGSGRSDSPNGALYHHHSPPPMHMGFQAQGYFLSPHPGFYDGPGPFSPPGPHMGAPLLYPPFFGPPYGYMPHPFPPQQMPPLVPYNAPNC